MIVLKDIKVSKVRIPVQNALWLRPVDKDTYKMYYPSGGNWKEIIFEANEDMDSTIEKRVEALENELKKVNVDISEIKIDLTSLDARIVRINTSLQVSITALAERVSILESAVGGLLDMMESEIRNVNLTDAFYSAADDGVLYSRSDMADFGITELVFRSIYDGYCKTADIQAESYTIAYDRAEDDVPGYGGIIYFNGQPVVDAETGTASYTQFRVVPEQVEDSVSNDSRWVYRIEVEQMGDEQPVPDDPEDPEDPEEPAEEEIETPILIGSLISDSSKKAYVTAANLFQLTSETVRAFSDSSMSVSAVDGEYTGVGYLDALQGDLAVFYVVSGIVKNLEILEIIEEEPADPIEPEPEPEQQEEE